MVVRARVAPPPPAEAEWVGSAPRWVSVPCKLLSAGDRRMEAESYLAGGRAIRESIEARASGWQRLGEVARVWQPSRLKGIQVGQEFGTPFLAATQVFDLRPVPRKWLALAQTDNTAQRFVDSGTVLVTRSGSVGRATLAHSPHKGLLISDDLLRVQPNAKRWNGWLYAFLRSPSAIEMMNASQYGHIIKHLEPSHLESIPVPRVAQPVLDEFGAGAAEVIALRDRAHELILQAEHTFESHFGLPEPDEDEAGFSVRASKTLFRGRRRFEAFSNRPVLKSIEEILGAGSEDMMTLPECGYSAWLPSRFKRVPASEGVEFIDSSQLFEINPDTSRTIADGNFGDPHDGRVKPNWVLMARSGQVYGINGSVTLATQAYSGKVVSDHVIRIAPRGEPAARPGYIFAALSHPSLGRPRVKALASGSSIPGIDPDDVSGMPIPRLRGPDEEAIADLVEEAFELRGRADILENAAAKRADDIVEKLRRGDLSDLDATDGYRIGSDRQHLLEGPRNSGGRRKGRS